MKKSAEKIGQLLNYEKLSNLPLLELPQVEKKDIPDYIQCPKYEKAKKKLDAKMERHTTKIARITKDIQNKNAEYNALDNERDKLAGRADPLFGVNENNIDSVNAARSRRNDLLDLMRKASEKRDDYIDSLSEAEEEAKEALEELTAEALQVIDEDIPMLINRLEGIVSNLVSSEETEDILAAIDVCLIGLRVHVMFDDLIDDNSARKECKDGIAKISQTLSILCAEDNIQNYMIDIYRRNLDLVQKNAGLSKQIDGVLASVDQKQLDALSKSINVVLAEKFKTKFDYGNVIDPAEIDKIVDEIKKTIDALKLNIEKAKAFQAAETPAVVLGKAGVNSDQQAKSLRASMQTNVDTLDGPLTQNHFAVQIIDEAVIEDFYEKDLRVAITALRKHIIDTIGEANFEGVFKGEDDRFSLTKGQKAIDKANLTRLQTTLDKIPSHIKELTTKITNAESDIHKANEVPKYNADTLSAELGTKYTMACIPVIGLFSATGIRSQVKNFETAFRGTNQIYKDLGNALLAKNKKMNIVVMIIGAILSFGSLIYFLASGGPVVISVIVLVAYVISVLMLFLTGKQLQSYLGISGVTGGDITTGEQTVCD